MNLRVSGPLPEGLAIEPKYNSEQAPKEGKGHVRHNGWNISVCRNPWGDELAETITPDVLVDRDGDEDASSHRFIRVNCVCRRNSGQCSYLDACTSISNDNDGLRVCKFFFGTEFMWTLSGMK